MVGLQYLVKPWKHQEQIIERNKFHKNFALFMDMGTGKTATTINILRLKYYEHQKILRTLVLCPPVMVNTWKREFGVHSKVGKEVVPLLGTGKKRVKDLSEILAKNESKIVVTNYESLTMDDLFKLFKTWSPTCIVFDESHKLKNYKAKRTKLAIELADTATYKYLLSGTPILNNPMDIWAQYRILDGGETFDRNFFSFRARYFYDKNAGMPSQKYFPDWRPVPGVEKQFNALIYKKAARVLKKDCLDLPPLLRKTVEVTMSKKQAHAYEEMRKHLIAYLSDEKACVATMALTKCLRLQQIVSGFMKLDDDSIHTFEEDNRIEALEEILEKTEGHKVIIWAIFQENYKAIEALLERLDIPFAKIVGGMTDKQRQAGIDAFQTDKTTRVMLANQQAGGVGVTLTAASYSVFYSRNFSLEADLQAEARNYRGGSEIHESITRVDLVAPGTIDEVIMEALLRKENLANNILSIKDKI